MIKVKPKILFNLLFLFNTWPKLNIFESFIRDPECHMRVMCKFNLGPASTGILLTNIFALIIIRIFTQVIIRVVIQCSLDRTRSIKRKASKACNVTMTVPWVPPVTIFSTFAKSRWKNRKRKLLKRWFADELFLSVSDHFAGLALKGLIDKRLYSNRP